MEAGDQFVIAPRGYHAFRLSTGRTIEVVDVEGRQCCDLVCFLEADPREKCSTHASIMRNGTIYLSKGHALYSSRHRPLLTIVDDSVGVGGHDLLAGTCSQRSNEAKFGVQGTPNCTANLTAAVAEFDIHGSLLGGAFNIFMRMTISESGRVQIHEPLSRAGDHIDLQAEMDCIVAISNCPQEWGATNARKPSPILLRVR
jgi:uncharacterized protein YcgI (DUF1989 family)